MFRTRSCPNTNQDNSPDTPSLGPSTCFRVNVMLVEFVIVDFVVCCFL
jgi:hypothetical protein